MPKTLYKINTPHSMIVVWNYDDKLSSFTVDESDDKTDTQIINEIFIGASSLVKVQTSKNKSNPVGNFKIHLAPTQNWVSRLSPGSWLAVLISQTPITESDLPPNGKANSKHVKMIGRISSTRVSVEVDEETGARKTLYTVEGIDWGSIFDSSLYIDPYAAGAIDKTGMGNATFLALLDAYISNKDGSVKLFETNEVIKRLLSMISTPLKMDISKYKEMSMSPSISLAIDMPKEMREYLGLKYSHKNNEGENDSLYNRLSFKCGRLNDYDKYEDTNFSFGFPNPSHFNGAVNIWQLLLDNSQPGLNELYNDLSWNGDKLELMLVNRVKPFIVKNDFIEEHTEVKDMQSLFKHIKAVEIPMVNVISMDAGTNWRDKVNFIEIKPEVYNMKGLDLIGKPYVQTYDFDAFDREGVRTMFVPSKHIACKPKHANSSSEIPGPDIESLAIWRSLLKEWYFNIHLMLNGTVTFAGIDEHIRVGDNIKVNIRLLNTTANFKKETIDIEDKYYMLAHVETVNHTFSVDSKGSRSFISVINFVRGIVVDKDGNAVEGDGMLDEFATWIPDNYKKNNVNVIESPIRHKDKRI